MRIEGGASIRKVERRTYIKGQFKGKYFGTLNTAKSAQLTEYYDIHIYEGSIIEAKNELRHPSLINQKIYEAITPKASLSQHYFQNIACFMENSMEGFNGYKICLHEPKLENIRITDVVKDGNQTFGTILGMVSGYLLDTTEQIIPKEPEVWFKVDEDGSEGLIDEPVRTPPKTGRYNPRLTGWGCLGFLGTLIGLSFLFSFGLPGIGIALLIGLLYLLFTGWGILGRLFRKIGRLAWLLLLLLFLVVFFNRNSIEEEVYQGVETSTQQRSNSIPKGDGHQNTSSTRHEIPNENTLSSETIPFRDEIEASDVQKEQLEAGAENIIPLQTNSTNTLLHVPESANAKRNTSGGLPENETDNPPIVSFENVKEPSAKRIKEQEPRNTTSKVQKVGEFRAPPEFFSGNLYICNGTSSKRYHLNPNCPGLSRCSTQIYTINLAQAQRLGRTLCQRED